MTATTEAPLRLRPYVSTGKTPLGGLAAGIGTGAIAAVVLSFLYVLGTVYVPIVQVEVLLTVGFGAAIGAATSRVMHQFKVRSRALTVASAIGLGVVGWCVAWLVWLDHTFGEEIGLSELANPILTASLVAQVYETGTWALGRSASSAPISGIMLGLVWIGEAAIIWGTSVAVALSMTHDRVFCELCDTWCAVATDRQYFDMSATEMLQSRLVEQGDLEILKTSPEPSDGGRWLSLKVAFCDQCCGTNALGIDMIVQTFDRGREVLTPKPFIAYHCITRDQMDTLRQRLRC